jgi:putative ABC transport system permease protein
MNVRLVALAIGLAILGGLVAGLLGGWRASRLRPVDAMRQVV